MADNKYQYRKLAELILSNPMNFRWSLQGLGMLRFYVTQEIRIHVWDSRYRVSEVSGVHTHPWHFDSTVLCGRVKQYRYRCNVGYDAMTGDPKSENYDQYVIRTGEGGGLDSVPAPCTLTPQWDYKNPSGLEVIEEGGCYAQRSDEIHLSMPEDGTVTVVNRKLANPHRPDHAFVFVPAGQDWVSAEAREAVPDEVFDITLNAMEKWI